MAELPVRKQIEVEMRMSNLEFGTLQYWRLSRCWNEVPIPGFKYTVQSGLVTARSIKDATPANKVLSRRVHDFMRAVVNKPDKEDTTLQSIPNISA